MAQPWEELLPTVTGEAMPSDSEKNGEEVVEPDNSTVDDWFGQNVARDQEVADKAVAEAGGDMDEAEKRFDEEADGEERYRAGHPRPNSE
jgi:hypothetical protein